MQAARCAAGPSLPQLLFPFSPPTTFADAAQPTGSSLAAPVSRIVLGVGSDATEANVAWQSLHPGEQFLEYWPKDDPEKTVRTPSTPGQNIVGIFLSLIHI